MYMPHQRFVILDRDGTINVEKEYLSDPEQLELLQGTTVGLQALQKLGLGLVVVTNQAGIGRGYFSLERLDQIHQRLTELLAVQDIRLDGIYFCPHHPQEGCICRKPQPGMLLQAAREHQFDPREAFVIGDKRIDIELGKRVGAVTFLVRTGYGVQTAAQETPIWDYLVDDLAGAAVIIEKLLALQSDSCAHLGLPGEAGSSSHVIGR